MVRQQIDNEINACDIFVVEEVNATRPNKKNDCPLLGNKIIAGNVRRRMGVFV